MTHKTSLINPESLLNAIDADFEYLAIQVFQYQYKYNAVYRQYSQLLKVDISRVLNICQIPFLPISFFKTHIVLTQFPAGENLKTGKEHHALATGNRFPGQGESYRGHVFESSGTTGETPSRHYVPDTAVYEKSLLNGFGQFYGPPEEYAVLALLPSYLERKNASLVHMADTLMRQSGHPDNGFYINEWEQLFQKLCRLEKAGQKTLLLGVTFALLEFAAAYPVPLKHTIVMETGGMKGRRQEMTRYEVHDILKNQFRLDKVHSEYGMTELLSQAYAKADGIFSSTNTMKVLARDINDPFELNITGSGCLNIIDLANVYSCSFIATDDIGTIAPDGTFEVLGRMDHSALRGCSLMAV